MTTGITATTKYMKHELKSHTDHALFFNATVKPLLLLLKDHNSWMLFLTALSNSRPMYEILLSEITMQHTTASHLSTVCPLFPPPYY